jgi:hypothetical protein
MKFVKCEQMDGQISFMKQQFVITHWYIILQETEKTWLILNTPTLNAMFLQKYKDKQFFCGHNILTESVFVTHLFSNVGILVWRIVWIMTNCCFMSDMMSLVVTICFANMSK